MLNIEKYKDDILNTEHADLSCCVNSDILKLDCFKSCSECKKAAMKWLLEEYKEPILDDTDKKYLSAVIKPFRNKVKYIAKFKSACSENEQYIHIGFYEGSHLTFPYFKENSMYKGMVLKKAYTPEELGL